MHFPVDKKSNFKKHIANVHRSTILSFEMLNCWNVKILEITIRTLTWNLHFNLDDPGESDWNHFKDNYIFCFRWYTKARKAMSKSSSTSSKCDDFSNFASSSLATHDFHIGSPTLMRTFMNGSQVGNSDSQRFSTR